MRVLPTFLFAVAMAAVCPAANALKVYVVDVEGGNAKLVVAPSGEAMLLDAGWPGMNGRDVGRIADAARAAGVKQIDALVVTHLDIDHVGDLALLATKVPVKRVYDNGSLATSGKGVEQRYETYAAVRDKMPHTVVRAGERIPMKGVDVLAVSAGLKPMGKAATGGGQANAACGTAARPAEIAEDKEDNMSIGLLFSYGRFRMLDLADLEGYYSYGLACPANLVGGVDVYLASVHGQAKGSSPALESAMRARVVVMNNGAKKGGDPQTWPVLRAAPGLEDIWQLHWSVAGGKEKNPPEDFIANLEAVNCGAKWIEISAGRDGGFTVTNGRNGFHRTYTARR